MLYLSIGNEPGLQPYHDRLTDLLSKHAPKNLQWHNHQFDQETHMSTPSKTLHDALLASGEHAGWVIPQKVAAKGLDAVISPLSSKKAKPWVLR